MKIVKFALASALIVTATSTVKAADITIKLLYPANHPEIYKPIVNAFTSSHKSIDVEMIPASGNYEGIMQALSRSRIINDEPDVSFLGFNFMRATGDTQAGIPLDPFVKAEGDMTADGYLKNMKEMCGYNGQQLGMPFAISLPIIYYNANLMQKAGIKTENLNFDWDQIISISKKINNIGDGVQGIYYSYTASGNWLLKSLIESAGGSMMDSNDKNITFDSKAGQWAFEVLNKIGDSGFLNATRKQAKQSFEAGKLGILVDSSSGVAKMTKATKGLFNMKIGAFPMPDPNGHFPAGGNCAVMTTHNPERQAAAWEFIKFITSSEGQIILGNTSGYIPNNKNVFEGNNDVAKRFSTNLNYMVVASELPYAGPSYMFPGENSVRITDVIEDYMRRILINEIEPATAIPAMKADVEKLLPK